MRLLTRIFHRWDWDMERAADWARPIPESWHEAAMLYPFYQAMTQEQRDTWLRELRDRYWYP
jgi:hypothetical protein